MDDGFASFVHISLYLSVHNFCAMLFLSTIALTLALIHSAFVQSVALNTLPQRYDEENQFPMAQYLSSPDCWLQAMQRLSTKERESSQPTSLDVATCAYMDTQNQQLLSLELARCHLNTLGRPLLDSDEDKCAWIDESNVVDCLKVLSSIGATTYTLFFKDIHSVCTRLLQENVATHYYETSIQLARISKLAQGRLQDMIDQHHQIIDGWQEREKEIRDWMQNQSLQYQNHTRLLEERMERLYNTELERHSKELKTLAATVQYTKQSIQPWAQSIQFVLSHATLGYSVLRILLTSIGTILAVLLFTFPLRMRGVRRLLFCSTVLGGFVAEIAILVLWKLDLIDNKTQTDYSHHLKQGLYHFLVFAYIGGLARCLFSPHAKPAEATNQIHLCSEEEKKLLLMVMQEINNRRMFPSSHCPNPSSNGMAETKLETELQQSPKVIPPIVTPPWVFPFHNTPNYQYPPWFFYEAEKARKIALQSPQVRVPTSGFSTPSSLDETTIREDTDVPPQESNADVSETQKSHEYNEKKRTNDLVDGEADVVPKTKRQRTL